MTKHETNVGCKDLVDLEIARAMRTTPLETLLNISRLHLVITGGAPIEAGKFTELQGIEHNIIFGVCRGTNINHVHSQ